MITVSDVLDFLEGFAPPELAESWDNVGLLCGDRRSEVTSVLCALDATDRPRCTACRCASSGDLHIGQSCYER